jgi:uncharacterized protein YfaS (alpha-2-macroglobulin family)
MANQRTRTAFVSLLTLSAASSGLVCTTVSPPNAPSGAAEVLLTRTAVDSPEPLVFPPPEGDRRVARPPLPEEYASRGAAAEPRVTEPALDKNSRFSFAGRTVRVVFDRAMAVAWGDKNDKKKPVPAAAGAVTISPSIAHTARWIDARTLEITADKPFDPKTSHELSLAGIESATGRPLGAWKATFTATPSFSVAGKTIGYIPVPGEHRTIAIHPASERKIGRAEVFSALFDQPIDLPLARSLVSLVTSSGAPVAFTVSHPASPTFQGVKVDPRLVVLIRPAAPLAREERVRLRVKDAVGGASRDESYDVADALELTGVGCGWGSEDCAWSGDTLHMTGRQVHVLYNNGIEGHDKALAARVSVSPLVRNLVVRNESWSEGRVVIEGAFEPSTRYAVSIGALADRYGNLAPPSRFTIETSALPASVAMAEGLVLLDDASTKRFAITTRNVAEAQIEAWPVPAGDAAAFQSALERVRAHGEPTGSPPVTVDVPISTPRDKLGETFVDLSTKLAAGQSYVARLSPKRFAHDATLGRSPSGSAASELPMALLGAGSPRSLAVHTRSFANGLLVHVARLGTGEPVPGASVVYGGDEASTAQMTGPMGVAWLPPPASGAGGLLLVKASDAERMVPLGAEGTKAKDLFPDLAAGAEASASSLRAMVLTDRGIYRPGSTVWIKASVRRPDGDRLAPVEDARAKLHVVGPTGEDVLSEDVTANDMGSVATKLEVPADAKLGRYQIRLEQGDHPEPPLSRAMVQVAEFEAPRFAVDIQAAEPRAQRDRKGALSEQFRAVVKGRYLFGSPMEGGSVSYTVKRRQAAFPGGPLIERGLVFRRKPRWYEEDEKESVWSRAGEGTLRADGTLAIEQAVPLDPGAGPQEITIEADVTDRSMRHVAARVSAVRHPVERYAGLRVPRSWVGVGDLVPVELGVIDTAGQPASGVPVIAKLEQLEYHSVQRRGPGGALRWEWTATRTEAGRCRVESARTEQTCSLRIPHAGSYEISAEVDGRRGGATSVWAYRDGDDAAAPAPSRGRTLEIVTDKPRYAKGDRAKLLVLSPFPGATAILTTEQGGLVEQRASRVRRGATVLEVPLTGAYAPYVHATVTLLPIGAKGEQVADYRIGAVRLPVSLDDARLDLAVRTDRPSYRPGEEAEITIDVKDGAAPSARAEIALAVVDEGVLRLTDFHAPDPVALLRPGRALDFHLYDTRRGLAELFEKSHVAGDGGGDALGTVGSTRKNFVETALWRPDLRADAAGRASVRFKLPDNLTQFRIMAVALDAAGKGASREAAFTVNKPVMAVPVVPRFAAVGDKLEVAAMVHNETGAPLAATVSLGGAKSSVTLPASGQARVGFPFTAEGEGDKLLAFSVADGEGHVLDRVEVHVRVEEPGVDERPALAGAFAKKQAIAFEVPADARGHGGDSIIVQVGENIWPELGGRLAYLLDYPHGCVEQTTSSTLPLLAARTILPRIGATRMSQVELDKRIAAGLARLASMRTSSGGLAYWPGGADPNVFGTAYAMRAVVLAQKAGVAPPRGLLEGMTAYLESALFSRENVPEVRAAIAQSLAELGKLQASAADALFEAGKESSVFGQASLALALGALGGQDDRVKGLLDEVEASFDAQGQLLRQPKHNDFYYYGSAARTRAQAAIALTHLRRGSKLLPRLLHDLAEQTERYTTQATAFSVIALAEHLQETTGEGSPARVTLDGKPVEASRDLGFGSRELRIPLAAVRGRKATLELASTGDAAVGYLISARWRRPVTAAGARAETRTVSAPSVYRVFTDAKGAPVDLARVHAGDMLRVAVLAVMPALDADRRGYLAITDRLPAGFEPIQPDLATVASVPDLDERHPFADKLRGWDATPASHVELRDDRVELYFDRVDRGDEVAGSYLVRAVTPGEFTLPPASGELMYEPDSSGYSEGGRVVVR